MRWALGLRACVVEIARQRGGSWGIGRLTMAAARGLVAVPEVEIDSEGVFKYILVRLKQGEEQRDVVRGTRSAEYHNHIFEKLNPEMEKLGIACKCLGGGKIEHNNKDKKIRVFGESTGYGKADHSVAVEKLKNVYTGYEITWSDDKK
ncbi:14 kDa phosphohistidine phosphatase-like [Rhinatrema bivittatum]|uniref:14 kDa phosphohistidine phosphatase-like n=1 Tax=Rhinatrema bivittatum TaxID=194408 RepID=UPI00112A5477|nr:14 kDa phosphohistidine phosphatase-like [Rhinatrema bivittatum]